MAIITQSSNVAINLTMQRRGLPLSYVVTAGNQAQTGISGIGSALLDDERVTALGLHIEGIDDLRGLEALAGKSQRLGKPVVVLKVGKSDQSRNAAVSHTASLAGSNSGSTALFRRLGMPQVNSLPEFLEALKLLHVVGPLESNRIASMSCSGGEAGLIADVAVGSSVTFPELTDTQHENLAAALGPMVKRANPLDYHTYIWANGAAMADTFDAMMEPSVALGLVVLDFPRPDRCEAPDWDVAVEAIVTAKRRSGRPMGVVATLPENMPEETALRLIDLGIAPMCGLNETIVAADVAAYCGKRHGTAVPVLVPRPPRNPVVLKEADAKRALQGAGVAIPSHRRADGALAAENAAKAIGFPVALKCEGVAHKTENAAVALNLCSSRMVHDAAATMPGTDFLVEEMLGNVIAELLVGVVLDPAHGYVLTVGAGGTLTELLDDKASLLAPASRQAVKDALSRLKMHKVLKGYRGQPAADTTAVVDAIMAVQTYVSENHGCIEEVEINPLLCRANDAVAADALIRAGEKND